MSSNVTILNRIYANNNDFVPMKTNTKWTEEEERTLTVMLKENYTNKEILNQFQNKSLSQVKYKTKELKKVLDKRGLSSREEEMAMLVINGKISYKDMLEHCTCRTEKGLRQLIDLQRRLIYLEKILKR